MNSLNIIDMLETLLDDSNVIDVCFYSDTKGTIDKFIYHVEILTLYPGYRAISGLGDTIELAMFELFNLYTKAKIADKQ